MSLDVLIAFYSRSGVTEAPAKAIAEGAMSEGAEDGVTKDSVKNRPSTKIHAENATEIFDHMDFDANFALRGLNDHPPASIGAESDLAKETSMTEDLQTLIEAAKKIDATPSQREEQRRSFAYGNTHFENDLITRDMIDQQAEALMREREARNLNV